jgi:signal transduction histidine kinase
VQHDDIIQWIRREPGMDLAEAVAGGWPLDEQSTLYVEGDLRRLGGTSVSVGITYAPLFDIQTQLRNIIANVRDITKFREAEEAKSTFVSVISHELKTPVSLIKGYASTLRRDDAEWDRETVQNGLQVIEEESDRLAELIENLLDVTRLQAGTLKLQRAPVAFDKMTERLAEKFRTQSTLHNISVAFPSPFPPVFGDEQRLTQALANLLSNAIKYSPDGGEITITGKFLNDSVQISVSDQGIGFSSDLAERVFDRFYRADNALTRETQGAGLGLYIVRSIIEAHGGHIWAESQPGQGATFHFSLPISKD